MSLYADTVWEMRTTGSNTNGGGFYDRDPGTSVDYSQQAAAQLSLSDLAMTAGTTTLTSATGGFTAAMVGNLIHINSGTNFTAGWYEVTAYTDTNTVTLDSDATNGSNASAGAGKVGGCLASFTPATVAVPVLENTFYIASGAYALTASVAFSDNKHCSFIGYKTVRGDAPSGDDSPLISCGAYLLNVNSGNQIFNIRFTGTASYVVKLRDRSMGKNLKVANSSATSSRSGIYTENGNVKAVDCDLVCTNGYAIQGLAAPMHYVGIYAHDSAYGTKADRNGAVFVGCFFDTCSIDGIYQGSNTGLLCIGCTFYNCGYAWRGYGSIHAMMLSNIVDSCTYGFHKSSVTNTFVVDYNNYHNNTTDVTNVTKGPNATADDPQFVDAVNGDFTLTAGSPCLTNGAPITLGVASSVTTHQGAVPPVAGGGSGPVRSPTGMTGGLSA